MNEAVAVLREVLDAAVKPATFFFRNDDVGPADDRLFRLLDLFEARALPIDLAVVPAALEDDLARHLAGQCATDHVRVHQHGWRHANHEPAGRKCEFGPSRNVEAQEADLEQGHARLQAALGPNLDPIFTPPWNRCTQTTLDLLGKGPWRVLSRDAGAAPLEARGLIELPVAVDWQKRRAKEVYAVQEVPVGVMLHHAVMTDDDFAALAALLDLLATHENARCRTMMACVADDSR